MLDISNRCHWRSSDCYKNSYKKRKLFEKSRLILSVEEDYPVSNVAKEADVSAVSAILFNQWLRDIYSHRPRLCNYDSPIKLGGPGIVAATYESLCSHKVNNILIINYL